MQPLALTDLNHLKLPYFKNRFKDFLLVNGKSIQIIRPDQEFVIASVSNLVQVLQESTKPLLLLAAPFAYSFTQETIPLKKK